MNCESTVGPDPPPKTVPFIEADLCDAGAVEAVFAQFSHIGAVMHFAGLKAVGESVRKPLEDYFNDLTSILVLMRAMQAIARRTTCSFGFPDGKVKLYKNRRL